MPTGAGTHQSRFGARLAATSYRLAQPTLIVLLNAHAPGHAPPGRPADSRLSGGSGRMF